jgi:hypothetical protein
MINVYEVDACRVEFNEDVLVAEGGAGNLVIQKVFGTAGLTNTNRFHFLPVYRNGDSALFNLFFAPPAVRFGTVEAEDLGFKTKPI